MFSYIDRHNILCYIVGVIVILRDFFRCGVCLSDMDGRPEGRFYSSAHVVMFVRFEA